MDDTIGSGIVDRSPANRLLVEHRAPNGAQRDGLANRNRERLVQIQLRAFRRDSQEMTVIDTLRRDLRYAVRTLTRRPGFAVAAVLALALGIGANTAVFSVVNAVLLRPLPYAEPDQLVWIQDGLAQSSRSSRWGACVADFLLWQSRSHSFEPLAAWAGNVFNVTGDGDAERVAGLGVTARFFDVLRVRPLRGRTFAPDEDQPGHTRVALISERLWERRYGRDPGIVGRNVELNGRAFIVIGLK